MRTNRLDARGVLGLSLVLAWAGCVSSHPVTPSPDAGETDAHVESDAALTCLSAGERGCSSTELPCCEGTVCQHGVYVLEYDTCVVPAADGEPCRYATDCVSGRCERDVCRSVSCVGEGGDCASDSGCCEGFCPAGVTYAPPVCGSPLPAGSWCYTDAWCASAACLDGTCL